MASRLNLHEELCELLGTRSVYFQPPASVRMKYPAIVYSLRGIDNVHANNGLYDQNRSYELIVIDDDPDSEIAEKVMKLPMCRFDRQYAADNLNHFAFTLYY